MVKKEGVIAVSGLGIAQYLQSFGNEGGAISPELLTQITQIVPLPILFIGAILLYLFRTDSTETKNGPPVICPYAPTKDQEHNSLS
jgi:hypothetical protein